MKRLSDYKGEEAVDLWMDILEIAAGIMADPKVQETAGMPPLKIAMTMVKLHKKEVCEILLRIDPAPIDGLNVVKRFVDVFSEIAEEPDLSDFFGMQGRSAQEESSGSATENTKEKEH